MYVKNRLEILEDRESNPVDLRCAIALEYISDTLNDIFYKLQDINSNLP